MNVNINNDLTKILLIVVAGGVLLYLINSYSKTQESKQKNENDAVDMFENQNVEDDEINASEISGQNEIYERVDSEKNDFTNKLPKDCFPKDQLSHEDLLPNDTNSKWAQVNPSGKGELGDQNFLSAGYHVGVNTVGQSLRNPNLQIRSEPPNPQKKVSPWMQTTMEPDINRKSLEIGGC